MGKLDLEQLSCFLIGFVFMAWYKVFYTRIKFSALPTCFFGNVVKRGLLRLMIMYI